ncbi:DNA repair ATPase [Paracrocinitomix mangrovi]|uniref:DNA repair ATPase n=1 Tax=Paracrocinitomix mangrovi TaxID=2862509 RepID=UPI001C8E24EC|nr:DNA repair ATPase [Paracrocinitomix mangrovi]UKN01920.1 DNA repair ATPase [Paracrocinitomix mangrovi]
MSEEEKVNTDENPKDGQQSLDGGTYDIIRKRLSKHGDELFQRMNNLNATRKELFGSVETKLLATERINTTNNCVPRDIISIGGNLFLFGYNVHIGLKSETFIQDVFGVFEFNPKEYSFQEGNLDAFQDETFLKDFSDLYKYYRETVFVKFIQLGPYLYMVFRIGKNISDIKTFKWLNQDGKLQYEGNRSDHEYKFPEQHEFTWKKVGRDQHVDGEHPHITIEDLVFVETIGGDLTVKVEDNTATGKGIYAEPVKNKDQTLDDADIFYSRIGNLILMKIRPYQEDDFRYLVYNHKVQEVKRIDAIADACILLSNDQGIIFPKGYYINTGEYKLFDNQLEGLIFEKRIPAANGEDYLYCFYNRDAGVYFLLSYNIIAQKVETPIVCNGFTLFENGELAMFKAQEEPQKHHAIQIMQTVYSTKELEGTADSSNYLTKIGNKEIVLALSECQELINLINKEDSFSNLYVDIVKKSTDVIDSYHWLSQKDAGHLEEPLKEIRSAASNAIEEFEKILQLKRSAKDKTEEVEKKAKDLLSKSKNMRVAKVNDIVQLLAELRHSKGEIIGLKSIRYVDLNRVENLENQISKAVDFASENCVNFLLKKEALDPYKEKVASIEKEVKELNKVVVANDLEKEINAVSAELELLIEIVSNLKILDATKTTQIIDSITALFSNFNQINSDLRKRRKELILVEGKAEFNAQIRLINQGFINYIDLADDPEKCNDYLNKLIVQLEELEGKFAEFDEYRVQIEEKREEIYNAFESKKVALVEAQNKRAQTLYSSADRILSGVKNRAESFDNVVDINGYFASDLMVDKVRDIIKNLVDLGDSTKADDVQSKLKSVKEEAIRQLNDKQELFAESGEGIKFGKHTFLVNTQKLDVTTVLRSDSIYFHLTGTNFYEEIENDLLNETREVWDMHLSSENRLVYRAEFLAYQMRKAILNEDLGLLHWAEKTQKEKQEWEQAFISKRFNEGYVKGIHDNDASKILSQLILKEESIGLLKYSSNERVKALLFWDYCLEATTKDRLSAQLKALGIIRSVFKSHNEADYISDQLLALIDPFEDVLEVEANTDRVVQYLIEEISLNEKFVLSHEAKQLVESFKKYLSNHKKTTVFNNAIFKDAPHWDDQFNQIQLWLKSFNRIENKLVQNRVVDEAAFYLLKNNKDLFYSSTVDVTAEITDLKGDHPVIEDGKYQLHYNDFMDKLLAFEASEVRMYHQYHDIKKRLTADFKDRIRLSEFMPRVLSSFVRNQLIDKVYLNIIGDNLAKQIGTAGADKRTDLMGMLLLISPPGYGKTTLMEYIASRLGLVFMKINGPALGHNVVSLDPEDADNAASREEIMKLNLGLEMGDNIMLYLDDIQHCNPEFLQKFISLADGQRKIEGVYNGKTKTYDFRGKKVVVVMAGNPYTESGEKFRIPDMLANRADIYNLGDILGDSDEEFKMSYLENSLTSNNVLGTLKDKGKKDVYNLIKVAQGQPLESITFENSYTSEELSDILAVLKMSLTVRDVVLKVNLEYIDSAGKEDVFRTEPPFKLQGSYRDMNKMVEKLNPLMNDQELDTLLMSHYENEAQTLTTGAEANLLKLKELIGKLSPEEQTRWNEIKKEYAKRQKLKGFGDSNEMIQVISQMENLNETLSGLGQNQDPDFMVQLKKLTEGVRAISTVMIENRDGEFKTTSKSSSTTKGKTTSSKTKGKKDTE